jgi:hypothetical protein
VSDQPGLHNETVSKTKTTPVLPKRKLKNQPNKNNPQSKTRKRVGGVAQWRRADLAGTGAPHAHAHTQKIKRTLIS